MGPCDERPERTADGNDDDRVRCTRTVGPATKVGGLITLLFAAAMVYLTLKVGSRSRPRAQRLRSRCGVLRYSDHHRDADRVADEVADRDEGAGRAGANCGAAGPDPESASEELVSWTRVALRLSDRGRMQGWTMVLVIRVLWGGPALQPRDW
jgi:hypothetical protein